MSGWLVTDLVSSNQIRSQQDALGGRHQISINNSAVEQTLTSQYYWAAPEAYLGNKVFVVMVSGAGISSTFAKNFGWPFTQSHCSLGHLAEYHIVFSPI